MRRLVSAPALVPACSPSAAAPALSFAGSVAFGAANAVLRATREGPATGSPRGQRSVGKPAQVAALQATTWRLSPGYALIGPLLYGRQLQRGRCARRPRWFPDYATIDVRSASVSVDAARPRVSIGSGDSNGAVAKARSTRAAPTAIVFVRPRDSRARPRVSAAPRPWETTQRRTTDRAASSVS